jgi:hypothetical protein
MPLLKIHPTLFFRVLAHAAGNALLAPEHATTLVLTLMCARQQCQEEEEPIALVSGSGHIADSCHLAAPLGMHQRLQTVNRALRYSVYPHFRSHQSQLAGDHCSAHAGVAMLVGLRHLQILLSMICACCSSEPVHHVVPASRVDALSCS